MILPWTSLGACPSNVRQPSDAHSARRHPVKLRAAQVPCAWHSTQDAAPRRGVDWKWWGYGTMSFLKTYFLSWETHGKTMGKPWENGDLPSGND